MGEGGPVLRIRILGCGSSGGVPRLDGDWGACDPHEEKNYRSRCSILLEQAETFGALSSDAATRLLIDTSPDLRTQWLAAQAPGLDGVVFTHTHADQLHGIDDLRALVYRRRAILAAFASTTVATEIVERFGYIFQTPPGSGYPPLLAMTELAAGSKAGLGGAGGEIAFQLFDVEHGGAACSGVRIGPIAYTPDVNGLNASAFKALSGVSVWIVDALREKPHPTHAHLAQSLDWLAQVKPTLGILTNLHIDLDYRALLQRLPGGVRPAFDGLSLTLDAGTGAILRVDPA